MPSTFQFCVIFEIKARIIVEVALALPTNIGTWGKYYNVSVRNKKKLTLLPRPNPIKKCRCNVEDLGLHLLELHKKVLLD